MEYLFDPKKELNTIYLGKALNRFQTQDLPKLKKLDKYYNGLHEIVNKHPSDVGKFCNKIMVNYCRNIVDNFTGYLVGKPVSYVGDNIEEITNVLDYNDINNHDTELLTNALTYGKAFEILYIDEDSKIRFKTLSPQECIPVYANNLNQDLLYVVRFYREDLLDKENENYIVEVYSDTDIKTYRSVPGWSSFTLIDQQPHFFKQVPISVFKLNENEESCFKQIISLQDAYNKLLSAEVDDFESFADAYLCLKGVVADEEDLIAMKKNRVLMLDTDADANYLTKNISDTQIENMLENIKKQIHKISCSPDFSDEEFGTKSGIAIRYKLLAFENKSADIEAHMKKVLQRRIELICTILGLLNDEVWRDVEISFTRNLPVDLNETATMVNNLRGLVSTETLLAQIPFVKDPAKEAEKVSAEQKVELYDQQLLDGQDQ